MQSLFPQECRKLQNFSSMSTIVSALQSATLASSTTSQLVLTRESGLSKSEKHILRQLEELLDPQGDHQAYREALKNINTPFFVPWLGAQCPSFHLNPVSTSNTLVSTVHLRSIKTSYDRSSA